jgi:murein DD-endopeptidase MepM/ murein hydrolase activator NlpD
VAYPGEVEGQAHVEPHGAMEGAPPVGSGDSGHVGPSESPSAPPADEGDSPRESLATASSGERESSESPAGASVAASGVDDAPRGETKPRGRLSSIPILDVMLDSPAPRTATSTDSTPHGEASPGRRATWGLVGGLLFMGGIFGTLVALEPGRADAVAASFLKAFERSPRAAAPVATTTAPATGSSADAPSASAHAPIVGPPAPLIPSAPIAGPWRVSQLAGAPDIKLVEGTMERRALVEALKDAGLPQNQVYRLLGVLTPLRKFDRPKRRDTFVVAMEPASHRLRAFEYQAGPTEIYQARENADGVLAAERLDLHVEKKRLATAVVVGNDLAASLQAVGLDPSLIDLLDDALEGRAQISHLHAGTRLRLVADYETALGTFARFTDVAAVEYLPTDPDAASLRVYHYHGGKSGKDEGYYDGKGHQPYKGGFRRPIPFGRISSGFNLRRVHPILKVVMPHNGVDFAADTGTPVFAACHGSVESVGDSGPSGNLVTIRHADGIITGYAHLSRFAPRLAPGQSVETRQLVGYVGSTGRSTGAHLHFSAKRNGVFIDPLSLKLDGDRVLPRHARMELEEERAPLDKMLDAIPLPAAPVASAPRPAAEGEDLEPADEAH